MTLVTIMDTENSSLSGRVYADFHPRKRIHFQARECVALPVVSTEADCAIALWNEKYWRRRFDCGCHDDPKLELLIYFCREEHRSRRILSTERIAYRPSPFFKVRVVLGCICCT